MADIEIDYGTISTVSGLLSSAETDINSRIVILLGQVTSLLTEPDGGLWMSQTSPAIQAQYDLFNSSAINCCAAITSFANMFSTLVLNLQSMDLNMAKNITTPPPSTSGQPASASS
jgi:hypothetical protein